MTASEKIMPLKIAKWFINHVDRSAGDDITHLKLQKLLYYAQAWHLGNYGKPLFAEDMQAWTHGPVVPSVWQHYRDFGWQSLSPENTKISLNAKLEKFLEAIYDTYGKYTAKNLEVMTHKELPWKKTRGDLPLEAKCTTPISKKLMCEYYGNRIGKKW